jgi:hypothetical protein
MLNLGNRKERKRKGKGKEKRRLVQSIKQKKTKWSEMKELTLTFDLVF